jgi:hypothetical protein
MQWRTNWSNYWGTCRREHVTRSRLPLKGKNMKEKT